MAGYLGAIPVPQATQHRESFTATSGQTTFNTAGYTVGFLDVYLNGSHLSPADFTATNGSDVVLASGASADDVCDIISYTAFEVADQTFTGTTTMDVAAITGVLTTTAATVFNGGFASNQESTIIAADGQADDAYVLTIKNQEATNDRSYGLRIEAGSTATDTSLSIKTHDNGTELFTVKGSGQARFVDGTASLPSISNIGDLNTGIFFPSADSIALSAGGTERMRIDSSGNVGIGTSSPQLVSAWNKVVHVHATGGSGSHIRFTDPTSGETGESGLVIGQYGLNSYIQNKENGFMLFSTVGTERMRIDSSGNLLVGTATNNDNDAGIRLRASGEIVSERAGLSLKLNRKSSDGEIARFQKDGTTVGSIGVRSDGMYHGSGDTGLKYYPAGNAIHPHNTDANSNRDNAIDLGMSSIRFDDIFATNGTIQTSDRNEKQDIAALTSAEMLVAKRISALFKTFRWKDSVAEKGDNARTHTGIIAQDVQAAFTAESLDSGDYSLFISTTWWEHDVEVPAVEAADAVDAVYREVTDSDGMVTNELVTSAKEAVEAVDAYTRTDTYDTQSEAPAGATSKTRMGIRYPELLSFVAAYNEQRFAAIETRLTALEG